MAIDPRTTLSTILDREDGRAVLARYLPDLVTSPVSSMLRGMPLSWVIDGAGTTWDSDLLRLQLWAELGELPGIEPPPPPEPPIAADPDYESPEVVVGSAGMTHPPTAPRWGVFEVVLHVRRTATRSSMSSCTRRSGAGRPPSMASIRPSRRVPS